MVRERARRAPRQDGKGSLREPALTQRAWGAAGCCGAAHRRSSAASWACRRRRPRASCASCRLCAAAPSRLLRPWHDPRRCAAGPGSSDGHAGGGRERERGPSINAAAARRAPLVPAERIRAHCAGARVGPRSGGTGDRESAPSASDCDCTLPAIPTPPHALSHPRACTNPGRHPPHRNRRSPGCSRWIQAARRRLIALPGAITTPQS